MRSPVSRFTVSGDSMFPTLIEGQDVISFNWVYLGRKPIVGEIIILSLNGRELIKRVTKLVGEEVFVEGDNKSASTDSRDFGPLNLDQIVGKVIFSSENHPERAERVEGSNMIDCPNCSSPVIGIYGRKDAICSNCGFKLTCCGEP